MDTKGIRKHVLIKKAILMITDVALDVLEGICPISMIDEIIRSLDKKVEEAIENLDKDKQIDPT